MRKIAVIDYGSGNLHSVVNALRAAAYDCAQDSADAYDVTLVSDGDALRDCDAIILPGVGHFADCRKNLQQATGLEEALHEMVRQKARPFLGICVGMQMLADTGHEGSAISGLGWISGDVHKLAPADKGLKIPHMGWNKLQMSRPHQVTAQMSQNAQVYFVHSYHFIAKQAEDVVANSDYGGDVSAIIAKETMIGTQFHPEKSQAEGQAFLRGFLGWRP